MLRPTCGRTKAKRLALPLGRWRPRTIRGRPEIGLICSVRGSGSGALTHTPWKRGFQVFKISNRSAHLYHPAWAAGGVCRRFLRQGDTPALVENVLAIPCAGKDRRGIVWEGEIDGRNSCEQRIFCEDTLVRVQKKQGPEQCLLLKCPRKNIPRPCSRRLEVCRGGVFRRS